MKKVSWSKIITFPLSLLYRIIVYTRNKLYDNGFIKQKELDNNIIISVGNISVGGTGKTPLVELIADNLLEKGKFLVIVLKGYMRKHDDIKVVELGYDNSKKNPLTTENFGDEAFIFLENLKNKNGRGLIIVGDDKTRAAKFAHAKFKPEVIIIDDGFQHRKLIRDLDIVILDGNEGKYLIPAGKLREPIKNKIRADIVVINEKFLDTRILQNLGHHSTVTCNYVSGNFKNIKNEEMDFNGKKVIAFCGIGDPDSFVKMMKKKNIIFNKLMRFADHHNYNLNDLNKIIAAFRNENADAILTTQKDFVRLSNSEIVKESETDNLYKQFLYNYPLYYAKIKMQITRNQELLFSHLDKVVKLV